MERAKTIGEAGYGGLLRLDESIWSESVTEDDVRQRYVDRRTGASEDPRAASIPVFDRLRKRLSLREARVFLTGQKGSGKSTELRRLLVDPEVKARFECVTMIASNWIDQGQSVDMRFVLLSVAAALSEHIDERRYQEIDGWSQAVGEFIKGWVDLLRGLRELPSEPQSMAFTSGFKVPLVETSLELRSDEKRRSKVLEDRALTVQRLERLLSELVALIERGAKREMLLVVDDGDKLAEESIAKSVFVEHGVVWLRLPCRAVITFPYWLHFEPAFNPIATQGTLLLLENVKVVKRGAPDAVLPGAFAFFQRLLDGMVEDRAALVDDDALEEVARLGAGIPREFLRVLERCFMRADDYAETRLTLDTVRYTAQDVRAELMRMTQNEPVRRSLVRVRLSKELRTSADWRLLDQLMVIEHRNDQPWYDVHPIIAREVDGLAEEYARRLERKGVPATHADVLDFLDGHGP